MGTTVVKRHGDTLLDKVYIPGILAGMKTTFKHFWTNLMDNSNLPTMAYPEVQPDDVTSRYRGVHRLTKHADESVKCVACFMCSTACPADCIFIEAEERYDGLAEKQPRKFDIDLLECIFCGYCVEACPCDAIRMDTGIFAFTGSKREDFVVDKERLMSHTRGSEFGPENLNSGIVE